MGRPKEFKQRQMISVTLEKEEMEMLEEIRWRERLELTEVGRKAIIEYIRNHKEGNETYTIDKYQDPDFLPTPTITARPEIWFRFLQSLSDKERLEMQIDSHRINKQCVEISKGTVRTRPK